MKVAGIDSTSLQAIKLVQGESVVYQGAPNLRQSIWHCYRILFNITWVIFLLGSAFAFFTYHVSMFWLQMSFGIYMSLLFLLSLIDAYTDRDVHYFVTSRRVIKLKGGKVEKQLDFGKITSITYKEKDGQGFFLFSGSEDIAGNMTVISFLGIEKVSAIYAALPPDLKKIADASKTALIQ